MTRKNVRPVGGKPLVAWTWEAGRAAPSVRRLLVSTDDPEVADLARAAGIDVPFRRPAALAADDTPAVEVALHALRWLEEREGYRPELLVWLQPTSPLRTADDIEKAVALLLAKRADSVVSVCPAGTHPYWMRKLDEEGRLLPLAGYADEGPRRRQDLPPVYRLNGAVYLVRREAFLRERSFFAGDVYGCVMPEERSVDVDTPWDLACADLRLKEGDVRAHN